MYRYERERERNHRRRNLKDVTTKAKDKKQVKTTSIGGAYGAREVLRWPFVVQGMITAEVSDIEIQLTSLYVSKRLLFCFQ